MPHFVKTFWKMRFVPSEEFYLAFPPRAPTHLPRQKGAPWVELGGEMKVKRQATGQGARQGHHRTIPGWTEPLGSCVVSTAHSVLSTTL